MKSLFFQICVSCFFLRILFGYNMKTTEGGVPEIETVVGGFAQLPCDVSVPNKPHLISLILWYQESSRAPIYTLDYRKGTHAKHFPSGSFSGRAQFDLDQRPPVLKLKPVYEEDKGRYKCRIEYRRSRTITRTVNLRVIVPPRDVVIMDDRGQRLKGVAGPYDEGAYISLICEAEGGDPLPSVTWWRNGALIDDSFAKTSQGHVRNELTILELRRNDLLAELVCQATNTNLTKSSNESIRIDLNMRPIYVRITTPRQPLKVGDDVRLDCETSGSRPPAKITWWMQNRKILSDEEPQLDGRSLTYSSIVVQPTKEDHGKSVTCKSDNPALPNSAIEDVWYLDVLYPPEVSLNLGANIKYSTIREGNDVYLECLIRANPPPTEVSWSVEGKPLISNPESGIIISNQSLVLQKVKKTHRGRYSCAAVNAEGRGKSLDLLLEVRYTPVCLPNKKAVYGVARGEIINISCEVDADPPDVSFRWALDNSVDQVPLRNFSSNGSYSTVTLAPKTVQEYGSVLCWARNTIGEQKEPCLTRIIAAGPPDPVRNCFVSNRTTTWLMVQCEPGYNGGLKQRFHLDIYNSAVEHLHLNTSAADYPSFSVANLPSATQFVLVIYASNEKGSSNSVALVGGTLMESAIHAGSASSGALGTLVAGALVFLGLLLLIGSLALGFFYLQKKRRRRKPKRKTQETKENTKFEEILKKFSDDVTENSIACPDVVPPNNGFGSEGSEMTLKTSEISESKLETSDTQKNLEKIEQHIKKEEIEVVVTNLGNTCKVVTRLSPSSNPSNGSTVISCCDDSIEPLDVEAQSDSKEQLVV